MSRLGRLLDHLERELPKLSFRLTEPTKDEPHRRLLCDEGEDGWHVELIHDKERAGLGEWHLASVRFSDVDHTIEGARARRLWDLVISRWR